VKIDFTNAFLKDIESVRDPKLKASIKEVIIDAQLSPGIRSIQNVSKLKGYRSCFRIKMGHYRFGLKLENNVLTFAAFHHRKDIYRHFPI